MYDILHKYCTRVVCRGRETAFVPSAHLSAAATAGRRFTHRRGEHAGARIVDDTAVARTEPPGRRRPDSQGFYLFCRRLKRSTNDPTDWSFSRRVRRWSSV